MRWALTADCSEGVQMRRQQTGRQRRGSPGGSLIAGWRGLPGRASTREPGCRALGRRENPLRVSPCRACRSSAGSSAAHWKMLTLGRSCDKAVRGSAGA